jgi:hypothetical protein
MQIFCVSIGDSAAGMPALDISFPHSCRRWWFNFFFQEQSNLTVAAADAV